MATFISGSELNSTIEKIFESSRSKMIIISPFIKFHPRIIDILKAKKEDDRLKIQIVFGKNEDKISKSLNEIDFNFLKEFPNIIIKYEPRLHAKYYANEEHSVLSSMNLYDYSQNNNIEFGIYTTSPSILDDLKGNTLDRDALSYFETVIKNSRTLFEKEPKREKANFGLTQKYTHSEILVDELSKEYNSTFSDSNQISEVNPSTNNIGFCIRTGEKISFNPNRPFSNKAYQTWAKWSDEDYSENFCHFSGEPSNGETSYRYPILQKNWRKSQQYF